MEQWISTINGIVWGPLMLSLISLTGLYLMIGLRGFPLRYLTTGFRQLWQGRQIDPNSKGDISGFNALMTSLSATIGTGNIAGVATAIALGGPGALFWMWMIALVGMATKYAEAVLAVRFRKTNADQKSIGGPMYYIEFGLGKKFRWLAICFALFGMLAGFGIGNGVQANSVADAVNTLTADQYPIPEWLTGLVIAVLAGAVLIGGIKRIAGWAGKLVPVMATAYVLSCLFILICQIEQIPSAFELIITHAFTPISASGGFVGATVWAAIRFGIARGVFSNEAGLGSAPIAHAAAATDSPVKQGTIAMLGTFIDTLIICTMTGLVIVVSGSWLSGENGVSLTSLAFANTLPNIGPYIVTCGLAIFAFTTIIGWAYYAERCAEYLFGLRIIPWFRACWVLMIPIGASQELNMIWLVADTLNALMALPNLIALLLLSPVVFALTKQALSSSALDSVSAPGGNPSDSSDSPNS